MSGAQSISARRAYGVQRVCRVWGRARSSVYVRRHATRSRASRRRGPVGAATDEVLVGHIRRVLEASPFHGEGYRKAWAKLRVERIRTSQERVRRLMREHGLQARLCCNFRAATSGWTTFGKHRTGSPIMPSDNPFKWRQFEPALILQCVRWYLRYALSYRDLEDMMRERGLCVDHTTIYRWVQRYAPEIDKRCRPFLRRTNDSYRIDETYVRVGGEFVGIRHRSIFGSREPGVPREVVAMA